QPFGGSGSAWSLTETTTALRIVSPRAGIPASCRLVASVLPLCMALGASPAGAHDPSAWGGLFRSRDGGATWLAVNAGSFVGGAIGVAVNPASPDHLLLTTDSGVLASKNGGRDWNVEAPDALIGAAFAVTYDADGSRALLS